MDRRDFLQLVGIGTVALPVVLDAATGPEDKNSTLHYRSIALPTLIYPALEIPGDWLAYTPAYELMGQGSSYQGAKESIESVIINYLDVYSRRRIELPLPKTQRPDEGFQDHINRYLSHLPSTKFVKDETRSVHPSDLPELVFEYFRIKS